MQFEFATAGRIIFGNGSIKQVGVISKAIGQRAIVVCGKNLDRAAELFEQARSRAAAHRAD